MATRQRSDDFLELVRRSRLGRLKVFLGPAAGVGKTYRMLEEAHALARRGIDVVIGAIDAHGRSETQALVEGLEQVPPRVFEYRGVRLEELDVDAVIARAPEVVLIDEVAHTNAPGSRRSKRYEDVLDVLRAGISVFCAFNVQHLESLNDMVRRATGVRVREQVPDAFLRRADQIVNLDLPADDLLERLRAGKVYPAERVAQALRGFFQREHLESLRELALRETAEAIERAQSNGGTVAAAEPHGRRLGRLVLCLASGSPRAKELLWRAARMAGRLNAHWYVLYVETPSEAPGRLDAAALRQMAEVHELARELGAEVRRIQSTEPVLGILEFARENGVRDIVVGVSNQPWYRQLLGLTVPHRLLRRARGFNLHLFASDATWEPEDS